MKAFELGAARPAVIAHRGVSRHHPENTLASFDAATTGSLSGMELDLQLSSDRVPVVYHDATLTKVGGGRKRVRDLTLAELEELDVGSWFDEAFEGERMPSLDQVLERYGKNLPLLLEIKSPGRALTGLRIRRPPVASMLQMLVEETVAAVRRHRMAERVYVLSFDPEVLQSVAALYPRLRRVRNFRHRPRLTAKMRSELEGLHAACFFIGSLTKRLVAELHAMKKPVLTYTCNTKPAVERALRAGVDAILSDDPHWVAAYLEERKARA